MLVHGGVGSKLAQRYFGPCRRDAAARIDIIIVICHLGVVGAFVLCSVHLDQRSAASAGLKLRDELEHLQARGLRLVGRERYVRQRQ